MALWLKLILLFVAENFFSSATQAALSSVDTRTKHSVVKFYKDFLATIHDEEKFENCFLFGNIENNEVLSVLLEIIVADLGKPIILQNNSNSNSTFEIANMYNRNTLIIAQIVRTELDLQALAVSLNRMRQQRIIFVCDKPESEDSTAGEILLQLFRACEAEKMLNVIAIFADFSETKIFHSYSSFYAFQMEHKVFSTSILNVYPNRMRDMHGYGIRTLPDQIFPLTFVYQQADGRLQVSGVLQKLLETFAKSMNATLVYPLPLVADEIRGPRELRKLLRTNQLDIPLSRKLLVPGDSFEEFTYPFSYSGLCVVAPIKRHRSLLEFYVEHHSHKYAVFTALGEFAMRILFYLCRRLQNSRARRPTHESFFTGLINSNYFHNPAHLRPLVTYRILTLLLLLWSICVLTYFSAHLNSYLTTPAMAPNPKSWDDLRNINQKVLLSLEYYNYILSWCDVCKNIDKSVAFDSSKTYFDNQRKALNTTYAYVVDEFLWHYMTLQMRSLRLPIFRLTNLCLTNHFYGCFQLQSNSIFKDSLNLFITKIVDHGLLSYWIDATYIEAISLGKIRNYDIQQRMEQPLDMDFMWFMWPMIGFCWTLCIVIFGLELAIGRWLVAVRQRYN